MAVEVHARLLESLAASHNYIRRQSSLPFRTGRLQPQRKGSHWVCMPVRQLTSRIAYGSSTFLWFNVCSIFFLMGTLKKTDFKMFCVKTFWKNESPYKWLTKVSLPPAAPSISIPGENRPSPRLFHPEILELSSCWLLMQCLCGRVCGGSGGQNSYTDYRVIWTKAGNL